MRIEGEYIQILQNTDILGYGVPLKKYRQVKSGQKSKKLIFKDLTP